MKYRKKNTNRGPTKKVVEIVRAPASGALIEILECGHTIAGRGQATERKCSKCADGEPVDWKPR